MTEKEWLTCENPIPMVMELQSKGLTDALAAFGKACFGTVQLPEVKGVRGWAVRAVPPAKQVRMLRCIRHLHYCTRPTVFSPEWRTDTAIALARTMYEAREFSAMPILADALQDAGCDNDDVLNHCRDTKQPHVRGCWVCELVLGKE